VDLVHQGIVDSLATLKLVSFLEEHFGIQLDADDANPENLRTLPDIAALVERKLKK
jgi:acyl carrier protein